MATKKPTTKKSKTVAPEKELETEVTLPTEEMTTETAPETDATVEAVKAPKVIKARGKKYQAVRAKLDKSKALTPADAVAMVKKLSYSKFAGSLEVHLIVKEAGMTANVTLPHSTGKVVRVAIATDELLADVEAGKVDFDILVSSPQFMGKLAKLARVLGPKGLMPNPKNGTLTDNPERKAKELAGGALTVKTEKKAPLVHIAIGKLSMEAKDLTENLEALLKAFKGRIVKISLAATMSPSVKVAVEQE